MYELALNPVKLRGKKPYWEVTVPLHPVGRRQVRFRLKEEAEKYFRACKLELRRTGRVELLSAHQNLVDAIEAMTMLKGVKDRSKMRKAAALYLESLNWIAKLKGEKPMRPFVEPLSRNLELGPALYRGLSSLARKRGASLEDLVCGVLHSYLQKESAGLIPSIGEEEVYRVRTALYRVGKKAA